MTFPSTYMYIDLPPNSIKRWIYLFWGFFCSIGQCLRFFCALHELKAEYMDPNLLVIWYVAKWKIDISVASQAIWIAFLFSSTALACANMHHLLIASSCCTDAKSQIFVRCFSSHLCEKSKVRGMLLRKHGAIIPDSSTASSEPLSCWQGLNIEKSMDFNQKAHLDSGLFANVKSATLSRTAMVAENIWSQTYVWL